MANYDHVKDQLATMALLKDQQANLKNKKSNYCQLPAVANEVSKKLV